MTIPTLISSLEAATGPDRELDGAIEVEARNAEAARTGLPRASWAVWETGRGAVYDTHTEYYAALFTASIDDAVALLERVLPGWCWYIGNSASDFLTDKDKPFSAELIGPVTYGVVDPECGEEAIYDAVHASASSAPLALVLAILRALSSKEPPNAE